MDSESDDESLQPVDYSIKKEINVFDAAFREARIKKEANEATASPMSPIPSSSATDNDIDLLKPPLVITLESEDEHQDNAST